MSRGRMYAKRRIRVSRAPYTRAGFIIHRAGKSIRIPRTRVSSATFMVQDRGAPGHGRKAFPIKDKGGMNRIAQHMGYDRTTEVPDDRIDEFVRNLVKRYGERSAFGKIHAMLVVRKRTRGPAKMKFEKMMASLHKLYGGGGWTPPG